MANFTRVAELDPRSSDRNTELALTGFVTREWPVVQVAAERLLAFHPDEAGTHTTNAWNALLARGDSAAAAAALRAGMAQSDSLEVLANYPAFLLERDPALAPAFARVSVATFSGDSAIYYAWRTGFEHRRGDSATERRYADSLRINVEPKAKQRPADPNYHGQLAVAYAGLGRSAHAVGEARKALDLVPQSRDAFTHTVRVYELASILVRAGQHEAAMDQIQYLTTIPNWYSANGYRYLPEWDPIRSNPRFQRLVAGMK
jgi:tetratricopeptide (TPR) repeat protein